MLPASIYNQEKSFFQNFFANSYYSGQNLGMQKFSSILHVKQKSWFFGCLRSPDLLPTKLQTSHFANIAKFYLSITEIFSTFPRRGQSHRGVDLRGLSHSC